MVAKIQRSLRFEHEAYNGVLRVSYPDENFTAAVNRVLLVGIDAIERESQSKHDKAKFEPQTEYDETQTGHDENTSKYVMYLEEQNKWLIAEHDKDRAVIAEKDKQIAQALERAQELTAQSNHIALAAQELRQIPATTTGEEITVVMEGEEITQETTNEQEQPAQVETPPDEEPKKRGWWASLWG